MRKLFKPAVILMNKMKYPKKFGIISILFFGLITVLLGILTVQLQNKIAVSERQLKGIEYSTALRNLVKHFQQHRGLSSAYLGGKAELKEGLLGKGKEVKQDIAAVDLIDSKYGSYLNSTSEWKNLKDMWGRLENENLKLTAGESIARHTEVIGQALNFTSVIADNSMLILNDKVDTYYLVDAVIHKLPKVTEYMGQARATGASVAAKRNLQDSERYKLMFLSQVISSSINDTQRGMEVVYSKEASLKSELETLNKEAFKASSDLVGKINNELLNTENITLDADDYYSFATQTIDDIYELLNKESAILEDGVKKEIQLFKNTRNLSIGISIVTLLAVAYLFIGFYLAIAGTILAIEKWSLKASEGDLSHKLNHSVKDETKNIIDALNNMIAAFSEVLALSKAVSEEVADSSRNLSEAALQTSEAVNQVADASSHIANGADMQLRNTLEISTAVEEISKGIQGVSEKSFNVLEYSRTMELKVEEGNKSIVGAVGQINNISNSVDVTYNAIERLEQKSQNINSIVNYITSIASQTNLLALNAAIEASRVGELGKGFAVVADEVRKLAEQSSKAAKDIAFELREILDTAGKSLENISIVKEEVRNGLGAISSAGDAFEGILFEAKNIVAQIDEVSAASEEMSASSQQVAASVAEVSRIAKISAESTQNAAASTEQQLASMEEIALSAEKLSEKSEEMNRLINKFKI